ncbi:precorrin-6A synthase (deacetylating) [Thiorhodovibrio frisius]|uniref:Precorrin-6A synthase, deacetylating n=1 Tax=Thiorhodovibrio frisius TaxID=631362 RepID=H8Z036_9GAMM|nr:precorrin-6A synthase (deacetylating) [Thiorhodovibrio frisius]EIC21209.1 precorrin-6A synthase, deacetylating [Thiorhodovibrio frisius]WPL23785.1 precorrin 6A synthase [Thiorhodovibrio frisius]
MKNISLIGIGPGGPDLVTTEAIAAMRAVDVFFLLDKDGPGKESLIAAREAIMASYLEPGSYRVARAPSPARARTAEGYLEVVQDWHARKRALFAELIARELKNGQTGALLIWGDPSLYDQSVSLFAELVAEQPPGSPDALRLEVIPGLTAVQVLTARHAIALNRIGEPIVITTGRQLEQADPATVDNTVVMLDGRGAFRHCLGQGLFIHWGANLGTADEVLIAGPLDTVAEDIITTLERLRGERGWLMDIYLLRRPERQP